MDNKQDSDPDSDSAPPVQLNKKTERLIIPLIGLIFFACFTLMCLSAIVYSIAPRFIDNSPLSAILTDKPIENQIAFVGNDHNIWLVSPDGSHLRSLTGNERKNRDYLFPVWSPNGRHLAFIGQEDNRQAALYVTSPNAPTPRAYYNVAASSPFYLYWLPDSQTISFLTQETDDIALWRLDLSSPETPRVLEWGQPFYWTWSPQGDELLMHVGGSRAVSEEAHLSFLKSQPDATRIELQLAPGRFQSPLWSADGQNIYYVAMEEDDREAIYRMDTGSLEQTKLIDLTGGGAAYLTISPDSRHIAYLETDNAHPIPFGRAWIMDADGQNHRSVTKRSVASAYWSPDGSKLALLVLSFAENTPSVKTGGLAAPAAQKIQFQWWVYHLDTGQLESLFTIDPTADFLQITPYFDQYHVSLTFWSPDSRYLVVTTEDTDKQGSVIVLDTTGEESPRPVGGGTLAVWSWQ